MILRLLTPLLGMMVLTGCEALQVQSDVPSQELGQLQEELQQQKQLLSQQQHELQRLGEQQQAMTIAVSGLTEHIARLVEVAESRDEVSTQIAAEPDQVLTTAAADEDVRLDDKVLLGRVEWLWLYESQRYVKARIDTGARTSSIDATDIQVVERDGKQWVKFQCRYKAEGFAMEGELVKYAEVKQASSPEKHKRPVVRLNVKIGDLEGESEFTLNDRDHMLYPVLIGRNFIRDVAIVDVSKKFIHKRVPLSSFVQPSYPN